MVTPTERLAVLPNESVNEIVDVPPPTAVSVNAPLLVAEPLVSSRCTAPADAPLATVTTAVFDDVAVNVPV